MSGGYLIPDSWGPVLWDQAVEAYMPGVISRLWMTDEDVAERRAEAERIVTEQFGPRESYEGRAES